jgi:cathepsin A (carboxypeptidase C)
MLLFYLVTAPCDIDELCYAEAEMITKYLNLESSFQALGVPAAIKKYSPMSSEIERAFLRTVDIQISTEPQVHYLLSNQVDVLIYQGNLDLVCNTAGAQRWASNFQWKGQAEFTSKAMKPWMTIVNGTETKVGTFKEVNIKMVESDEKTTRFALVTVDGSGHMVCVFRCYRCEIW